MIPSRPRTDLLVAVLASGALLSACADIDSTLPADTTTTAAPACVPKEGPGPHDLLSDYCLYQGELKDLVPAANAFEYDVAAALWSDHAAKQRLIVLPEGQKITFDPGEDWRFPTGTLIAKTFSFYDDFRDLSSPHHILETRLLVLGEGGWTGTIYRWNEEQTDATRLVAGERVDVGYIDEDGESYQEEYLVPNENQCKSCHERDDQIVVLGPFTQQLNRDIQVGGAGKNQLAEMADRGMFDVTPDPAALPAFPDPFGDSASLDERARSYLHANCSHCHRPGGGGGLSGLVLLNWERDPGKNGVCKEPAAAGPGTGGNFYDIVPGHPEQSILIYRVSSTDPQIKMPELPNRIVDKRGVKLLTEWIAAMEPAACSEP